MSETFSVWFLIGAALVFWMQAGFAMVEAGFTRSKNTGNIIMKNLMDFCIGTCTFILIGFSFLFIQLKLIGFGVVDGYHNLVSMILLDHVQFIWLVVSLH